MNSPMHSVSLVGPAVVLRAAPRFEMSFFHDESATQSASCCMDSVLRMRNEATEDGSWHAGDSSTEATEPSTWSLDPMFSSVEGRDNASFLRGRADVDVSISGAALVSPLRPPPLRHSAPLSSIISSASSSCETVEISMLRLTAGAFAARAVKGMHCRKERLRNHDSHPPEVHDATGTLQVLKQHHATTTTTSDHDMTEFLFKYVVHTADA